MHSCQPAVHPRQEALLLQATKPLDAKILPPPYAPPAQMTMGCLVNKHGGAEDIQYLPGEPMLQEASKVDRTSSCS